MTDNVKHAGTYVETLRGIAALTDDFDLTGGGATSADVATSVSPLENLSNGLHVVRGRAYLVDDADDTPMTDEAALSFYTKSGRRGEDCLWRANIAVAYTLLNGGISLPAPGTPTITVDDGSIFSAGDLVVIDPDTVNEEFLRIEDISTNTLLMEDGWTIAHADNALICFVAEFGGFMLWEDGTATDQIYSRLDYGAAATPDYNVRMDLQVRR